MSMLGSVSKRREEGRIRETAVNDTGERGRPSARVQGYFRQRSGPLFLLQAICHPEQVLTAQSESHLADAIAEFLVRPGQHARIGLRVPILPGPTALNAGSHLAANRELLL